MATARIFKRHSRDESSKEGGERAQAVYSKKIGNQDDIINLDIINLE